MSRRLSPSYLTCMVCADQRLRTILLNSADDSKERLHASLAPLPRDPSQVDYLEKRLLSASGSEIDVIWQSLSDYTSRVIEDLWRAAESPTVSDTGQLLQAGRVLVR